MPMVASLILLWILAGTMVVAVAHWRDIAAAWREPVLRDPVLIIESDDWGYGPLEQAQRLRELARLLARHQDHTGHPAVMTLGVILAGPDTQRIAQDGCARYHRTSLAEAPLGEVR